MSSRPPTHPSAHPFFTSIDPSPIFYLLMYSSTYFSSFTHISFPPIFASVHLPPHSSSVHPSSFPSIHPCIHTPSLSVYIFIHSYLSLTHPSSPPILPCIHPPTHPSPTSFPLPPTFTFPQPSLPDHTLCWTLRLRPSVQDLSFSLFKQAG